MNELNSGHMELEVFVRHPYGDVLWILGNGDLDLIMTKVSRVWLHTNDH